MRFSKRAASPCVKLSSSMQASCTGGATATAGAGAAAAAGSGAGKAGAGAGSGTGGATLAADAGSSLMRSG